MRIAVLVIGALRTLPCHIKNIYEGFSKRGWETDYYFCISNSGNASVSNSKGRHYSGHVDRGLEMRRMVNDTYKPIVTMDVSSKYVENKRCSVTRANKSKRFDRSAQSPLERMWETLASVQKCYDHMESIEYKENFLYDYVWRLRPDLVFYAPLPSKLFDVATFPLGRVLCNGGQKCLNDHIAILPRHAASRFFRIANEYLWCNGTQSEWSYYIAELLYTRFENAHTVDPLIRYTLVRPNGMDCARVPGKEYRMCKNYEKLMINAAKNDNASSTLGCAMNF